LRSSIVIVQDCDEFAPCLLAPKFKADATFPVIAMKETQATVPGLPIAHKTALVNSLIAVLNNNNSQSEKFWSRTLWMAAADKLRTVVRRIMS